MGAINIHYNRQMTFGDNYEPFTVANLFNLKNSNTIRFTKDGEKSVFNSRYVNENNKEDIEKLYNFFDLNTNKDGNLTYRELFNEISDIMGYIVSDNDVQHIDAEYLNNHLKLVGLDLKDNNSLLTFIKAAEEFADITKNLEAGYYNIDGDTALYNVHKYKKDSDGRTYELKNLETGTTILASFGGQNNKTQKMVSEFYARILNNPELEIKEVSFNAKDFGEVKGVTIPDTKPQKLNKNTKLGLDVFFSNDESKDYISYAGVLDQNSRGLNTKFSFIPYEFSSIVKNGRFDRNNVIKALQTIVNIPDEEIKSTLAKYNNTERYEDTLLKKKAFCEEMLKQAQKFEQQEGESLKDYVNKLQIHTLGKMLKNVDNISDLKAFSDAIETIEDKDFKSALNELIQTKRTQLTSQNIINEEFEPLTKEEIKKYFLANQIDNNDTKFLTKRLGNGYTENMKSQLLGNRYLDYYALTKIINGMRKNGIDVLKDNESFTDFQIYIAVMWPKNYSILEFDIDKNTYDMIVNTTKHNLPNPQEMDAIDFYKYDGTYLQLHIGTDGLLKNDIEPTPQIKEKMEVLNNYLHKYRMPTDIKVYRGEHAGIFNNITMPNGKSLGTELMEIYSETVKEGELSQDIKDRINYVIDFVNNNNLEIENTRFCSTSIDPTVADRFHEVGLDLDLPAGSSAICIDAVNFNGKQPGEGEVLASYGSVEQITGARFDADKERIIFTGKLITDVNK